MKESKEEQEIKEFYDSVYYKEITHSVKVSSYQLRLAKKLGITTTDNVLDVACGTGEFLRACDVLGAKVSGVDLSDKAIIACKAILSHGGFHSCSAEKLPFDDDSFDVVTCLGSLEHFIDPVASLKEMVRVAKPKAKFVILVPNKDFLTRKLKLFSGTYQVDAKEEVRTLDEWNNLFNLAGLSVSHRWKDLHVVSSSWILLNGWKFMLPRLFQALALCVWPLKWQYQIFHLASVKKA
ncbi:MAG: class I SAM-dependent methyltransferase [Cycloclasticus sp.]|nr:class I SAM-dependent methyltransferase [Cycloclasticus sp.]